MEVIYSLRPLLAVLVSIAAIAPILLSDRRPNLREGWTFLAAFIKFGIVVSMLPAVLGGAVYECTLFQFFPGVAFKFKVDSLGILFALVASTLWILTSCYAIGYMRGLKEHAQTRFFVFVALALSATIGVAFSANLLTMYLFYEMLSLSTYPLVTHHQDREARSAGRKYLLYILGTSVGFVLPAMVITYYHTGTLDFSAAGVFEKAAPAALLIPLLFMFLFGFAKSGLMPFHSWLPGAMVAPTPVSALLHAVAVVKVGVFSIIRVFTGIFGLERIGNLNFFDINLSPLIASIIALTLLCSSLIAISQDGLKRRLAFSTIGQLAYITLGVILLSPAGVSGGIMHIAMHAISKITLFFCAGAIFVASGKKYISEMGGIGKKMPFTMTAFFIASLGVVGLPPGGGFLSKWQLLMGTVEAEQWPFMCVYLLSSLLAAAYLFPVVFTAFFGKSEEGEESEEGVKEAPFCCVLPLCLTAIGSVVIFFKADLFYELAKASAKHALGG